MISSDFLGVRMTGTLDACIMVVLRLAADKKCINGDEILCIYAKRMMKFHINYESLSVSYTHLTLPTTERV